MESPRPDAVPDVAELAASLRADAGDLEVYARVLTGALADALPAGVVEIERRRSLADRVAGRDGTAAVVRINFDDASFELAQGPHQPQARVNIRSGGVVISRRTVTVAAWAEQLAARLAALASESQEARAALARLLGL